MTKTLKHNNRNLVLLIIIWALVLALTLIGVYMYYENKIEQLDESIEDPTGIHSLRLEASRLSDYSLMNDFRETIITTITMKIRCQLKPT